MNRRSSLKKTLLAAIAAALALPASAFAHAELSPAVSLSNRLQLYSLAVPTEKENAFTTKIVLTVPRGFSIDSFVPSPGWSRTLKQTGSGENAVVQQVTWAGGHVPTAEDALFQFLGQPSHTGTFTFQVQQTYSDGTVVDWNQSETGEDPAPTIEVKSSLGGGGTSTLSIVALVVGAVGVIIGGAALLSRGGRPLT
jgi:uncharacterized protein YcnI